jgi:hypothetical protein
MIDKTNKENSQENQEELYRLKEVFRDKLTIKKLEKALSESLKLQKHYAELLNCYDEGERRTFDSINEWMERLKEIGKL